MYLNKPQRVVGDGFRAHFLGLNSDPHALLILGPPLTGHNVARDVTFVVV